MSKRSEQQGVTAGAKGARARIERAAATLFAERGADVVTTREIAEKAGASEGALYRHFPSKAALADGAAGRTVCSVSPTRAAPTPARLPRRPPTASQPRRSSPPLLAPPTANWALFCFALLTRRRPPRGAKPANAAAGDANDPVDEMRNSLYKGAMDAGARAERGMQLW